MIKKIYCASALIIVSLYLCGLECNQLDDNSQEGNMMKELKADDALYKIAQKYLKFIHDVGSAESVSQTDPRIKTLFAENLTKIDNTVILFENNRESLLPQMKGFEKEYNHLSNKPDWIVAYDNALIIPSSETNSVVIHFEWVHINVGKGTTTVILQCNSDNKVERIIDVWAKVPH